MAILTLVAQLAAKPGQERALHQALTALIAPTRAEDGCLRYDLYRDLEDGARFTLLEDWASRPQWERHMETAHLKAFMGLVDTLVADWRLQQLEAIDRRG